MFDDEEEYCECCDEFHTPIGKSDIKKEPTMTDTSLIYIERRLENIYFWKQNYARDHFMRRTWPKDLAQMKAWLKSGNYIINPERKDDAALYEEAGIYDIFWDKKIPDPKGYDEAIGKLNAAKQKARDIINISTDEKIRLDALKEFESFTVH